MSHSYLFNVSLSSIAGIPAQYHQVRAVVYQLPSGKHLGSLRLFKPLHQEVHWASQPLSNTTHHLKFKTHLQPVQETGSSTLYAPKHVELSLQGKQGKHAVPLLEEWADIGALTLDLSAFASIEGEYQARLPVTATNVNTGHNVDMLLSVTSWPSKHARHEHHSKLEHNRSAARSFKMQQPLAEGLAPNTALGPEPRIPATKDTLPSASSATRSGLEPQGVEVSHEDISRMTHQQPPATSGTETHSYLAPPRASPRKQPLLPTLAQAATGAAATQQPQQTAPAAASPAAVTEQPDLPASVQSGSDEAASGPLAPQRPMPSVALGTGAQGVEAGDDMTGTEPGVSPQDTTTGLSARASHDVFTSPFTSSSTSSDTISHVPVVEMHTRAPSPPLPGDSLHYTGTAFPFLDTIEETSSGQPSSVSSDNALASKGRDAAVQPGRYPEGAVMPGRHMKSDDTPMTPHPSLADEMMGGQAPEHQGSSSGILSNTVAAAAGALLAAASAVSKVVSGGRGLSRDSPPSSPPTSITVTGLAGDRTQSGEGSGCGGELQPGQALAGNGNAGVVEPDLLAGASSGGGVSTTQQVVEQTRTAGERVVEATGQTAHAAINTAAGSVAGVVGATGGMVAAGAGGLATAAQLPVSTGQSAIKGVANAAINLAELPVELVKGGVRGTAAVGAGLLQAPVNAYERLGKGALGLAAGVARAPVQAPQAVIQGGASVTAAVLEAPLELARHVITGGTDLGAAVVKAPAAAAGAAAQGLARGTAGTAQAATHMIAEPVGHAVVWAGEMSGKAAVTTAGAVAGPVLGGLAAGVTRLAAGQEKEVQDVEPAGDEATTAKAPKPTTAGSMKPASPGVFRQLMHASSQGVQGSLSVLGWLTRAGLIATAAVLGLGSGLFVGAGLLTAGVMLTLVKGVTSVLPHWPAHPTAAGPHAPSLITRAWQLPGALLAGLMSWLVAVMGTLGRWADVELGELNQRSILRQQGPGSTLSHMMRDLLISPTAAALPVSMYEFPPGGQDVLHDLYTQRHDDLPYKVARYNEQLCGLRPPHLAPPRSGPSMVQRVKDALLYTTPHAVSQATHHAADSLTRAAGAAERGAAGVVRQTEHLASAAAHQATSSAAGLLGTLMLVAKNLGRMGLHLSAAGIAVSLVGLVGMATFAVSASAAVLALAVLGSKVCLSGVDRAAAFLGHAVCGTAQYLGDWIEGRHHKRQDAVGQPLIPAALPHLRLPSAKRALIKGRFAHHAPLSLLTGQPPLPPPITQYSRTSQQQQGVLRRAADVLLSPVVPLVKLQLMLPVLAVASAFAQVDWAAWRLRQLVAEVLVALPGTSRSVDVLPRHT